ncbi:hypothetical protein [Ligilactobacillus agilis]|uniref:hypothetical protein n=1 Tax=Ligilactobacillus agilis TaxID=1601 RepID=UPI00067EF618|nr:hypothetical protein [Ligilactobacillus agilis]
MDKGYLVGTIKGKYLDECDNLVNVSERPTVYETKKDALEDAEKYGLFAFEIFPMLITEGTEDDEKD